MARAKKSVAVSVEKFGITDPPTVDVKYILVTVETNIAGKHFFEEAVSKKIREGWKPQGGVDVKSTSTSGWLFSQAMVKE